MSGPVTPVDGKKRALDLLEAILDQEEYITVLKFAHERGLDSDSEVFFLISMLKIFAHVLARTLAGIEQAETGRKSMEAAVIRAEERLAQTMEQEVDFFESGMAKATAFMAHQASRFEKVAHEMAALRDGLRAVTSDATRVLDAYHTIKGDRPIVPLARIFFDQFKAELKARAPEFETRVGVLLVDAITLAVRRILFAIGGATLLISLLVLVHRR